MKSAARLPVYPGCTKSSKKKEEQCTERRILGFIDQKLKYPPAALQKGVQGTVTVFFIVEKDGSITGVRAANDIGGGCADEAVRIVSQLPKFRPGLNATGNPVRINYILPITFRLR
jgi:TonB family protein